MGISAYLREIGRGKDGARALTREQAADLFGQVLDGAVTDLELGAFCIAMRVKGEAPQELAGFLDATHARMKLVPAGALPLIVLPSYNGARKLPLLTPLLGLLLAREGLPVLIHGTQTEVSRVAVADVLAALDIEPLREVRAIAPGELACLPTEVLCPGLKRLLDARRTIGLRNSAHSIVKLMNPCAGDAVVVGSFTHPEYAQSMAAVFELMGSTGMLLRGTEGEPVADPRRMRELVGFVRGQRV
ncbi:MAG TPA: DNA-binding protein YbiB, partial [Ramlibacter sp.]